MNALASRKRLLIAESELNRVQHSEDIAAVTAGIHALTNQAKSFGSIAASAAGLVAGLAALRRGRPAGSGQKTSRLKTILTGAGLVSNLWLVFRAAVRDQAAK